MNDAIVLVHCGVVRLKTVSQDSDINVGAWCMAEG